MMTVLPKAQKNETTDRASTTQNTEVSVFDWVDSRHQFLVDTYDRLMIEPNRKHISRCLYLADQIQKACNDHSVGILAALQLNRHPKHRYIKELLAGVLCELIGREVGMSSSSRLLLICASLTQDVAMLDLQESTLDRQSSPLTDGQRRQIQKHPSAGRKIIEQAGVKDALWLDAVEQHHERLNGSGYPNRLKQEEISSGAKILACADSYAAMVRPRGDRGVKIPKVAIKEVYLMRGDALDTEVVRVLINILGIHPPGTWVKLANGEQGVVREPGEDRPFPRVAALLDCDGNTLLGSQIRDTAIKDCAVLDMIDTPFVFNLAAVLNKLWPKIPAS
ncbi:MAG: HD domain-containing protein [Motiliproteus sp.]|nr:HD domain-containing protein [Motiliproteus sp.]MCW9051627.1 HD domain-containing protein [Motiliproteus sp.]